MTTLKNSIHDPAYPFCRALYRPEAKMCEGQYYENWKPIWKPIDGRNLFCSAEQAIYEADQFLIGR